MAENEEPPTPPTGMPALPAQSAGAQPVLPPGLNADEYRRFQEFQRFQDYQRFVEAQQRGEQPSQPPAPVPVPSDELATHLSAMRQQLARIERVTNPPTWQKVLRNKWLHRGIWLLILVLLATWGVPTLIQHYFGNNDSGKGPAALPLPVGQAGILPEGPHQAVADIYMYVAAGNVQYACLILNGPAQHEFAVAAGAGTCPAAVTALHARVTDPSAYGQPDLTFLPSPDGTTTTISSCDFHVSGGPRLGTFSLTRRQQGWQVTGYEPPGPCPTTTSAPPT